MANSEWDGLPLPDMWVRAKSHAKCMVIAHLQSRGEAPHWWLDMNDADRRAVVLHLCAVGSVDPLSHPRVRAISGKTSFAAMYKCRHLEDHDKTIGRRPQPYFTRDEAATLRFDLRPIVEPMLYPKPNGGKRVLPSVYTKLTTHWLRANGVFQKPELMNQGHLANTIALLNESHVNLVDRMSKVLGRMHNHLSNRPDLQEKIVDLFHELEVLQVEDLYPIIELLASYVEPEMTMTSEGMAWLDEDDTKF